MNRRQLLASVFALAAAPAAARAAPELAPGWLDMDLRTFARAHPPIAASWRTLTPGEIMADIQRLFETMGSGPTAETLIMNAHAARRLR